jgi:hypothetical protein
LILNAKASPIPYEHRVSIHKRTQRQRAFACQAGVLFVNLVNNSSEGNKRSHADLMHNNRSAWRRFGKPLPQLVGQCFL